jgi:hypothetical protein
MISIKPTSRNGARPNDAISAPHIDRFRGDRGVVYVRREYFGSEGQGRFESLRIQRGDGSDCPMVDREINIRLTATFRALLTGRYPQWCLGDGSGGDFRWDLSADLLTHSHYTRGEASARSVHHNITTPSRPPISEVELVGQASADEVLRVVVQSHRQSTDKKQAPGITRARSNRGPIR